MEKLVSLMSANLAEILVIKLFDLVVFVGLALCLAGVLVIESLCAKFLNIEIHKILGANNGLAAACYAAAGASHNLDEVVLLLALFDRLEKLFGIAGAVSNRNINLDSVKVDFSFLNAVDSAYCGEINAVESVAGNDLINGTQSRFHNAEMCIRDR